MQKNRDVMIAELTGVFPYGLVFCPTGPFGGIGGDIPAVRFKPHHGANSGQYGRSAMERAWMTGRWLWIQKSDEAE